MKKILSIVTAALLITTTMMGGEGDDDKKFRFGLKVRSEEHTSELQSR